MRFAPILALILAVLIAQPLWAQEDALSPGGYRWVEEGPFDGPLYMVISIEKQMVHVYDGDRLVALASVSTGMKGHRTPTGEFPILQKREWHRSNLYSNAPMPFMQRLTWDGIALHAGQNPGYPASHGCIRLPYAFARKLFGMTKIGTLVSVTSDKLMPVLMVNAEVVADPQDAGSALVTFTPAPTPVDKAAPVQLAAVDARTVEQAAPMLPPMLPPMLAVDPAVFRPRLRRR
jgi:Uncharacterized protein conserved in bacteria